MITVIYFSLAYMVKGGWLSRIIPGFDGLRDDDDATARLLNGHFISGIMVFLYGLLTRDPAFAVAVTCAWIIGVFMSVGEEVGSIGRLHHWWGVYRDRGFRRTFGIKKALQRGAFMGCAFTLVTHSTLFIPVLSIGFVAAHFVMQEIYFRLHKADSCAYAEPVIGALIGFCLAYGGAT